MALHYVLRLSSDSICKVKSEFVYFIKMSANILEQLYEILIQILVYFHLDKYFVRKSLLDENVESLYHSELTDIPLEPDQPVPRSVNYHFTRQCNYECGFCFHTAKTSYVLNLEDAKKGLYMLKKAGKFFFIYCNKIIKIFLN